MFTLLSIRFALRVIMWRKCMTDFDLKLCDVQGRLFVLSVMHGYGSEKFIKIFMQSETAKALDSSYNCKQCFGEEYLFDEVIEMAGDIFKENDKVYPSECIYWIGYIYRYWHYHTNESSKEIYKQASAKVMKQNYARLHMMTSEEVIEVLKGNN